MLIIEETVPVIVPKMNWKQLVDGCRHAAPHSIVPFGQLPQQTGPTPMDGA